MHALYRKPFSLPSLVVAALLPACDNRLPSQSTEPIGDTYLEALQEVEALKYSLDERKREQQHTDALLGRNQTPAR